MQNVLDTEGDCNIFYQPGMDLRIWEDSFIQAMEEGEEKGKYPIKIFHPKLCISQWLHKFWQFPIN